MPAMGREEALAALDVEYRLLERVAGSLSEDDLLEASGCRGWSNADLLFHMLLDAQRALVTLNSPAAEPPDTDFVRYWEGHTAADANARANARYVRLSAAAHTDPKEITARWCETASAARRAAARADAPFVTTQGHVLATPDFVATLVVEAGIHHLDLVENLDGWPGPAPEAVDVTIRTLDGLLGRERPPGWDDHAYLLKATGRRLLTEEDKRALGDAVKRLPLFS